MSQPGHLIISGDTFLKGKIRNCRQLEIHGYVEGEVQADAIVVHEKGRLFGTIKAGKAEIHGELQGNARIQQVIRIGATGSVNGNVYYGQLVVDEGGMLTADVRNVPPSIAGDLDITVSRGKSIIITPVDLTAIDPDDEAQNLTFTVSGAVSGFVARKDAAETALDKFSQVELQSGKILFVHDGSAGSDSSFKVSVTDGSGASSGEPQTVTVNVR